MEFCILPRALLGAVFGAGLALATGCGLTKRADARAAVDISAAVLSTCASITTFRDVAMPVFQTRCVSCHGVGGVGNAAFYLVNGAVSSSAGIAAEYLSARRELLSDDGGDYEANPLMQYPIGQHSHPAVLNTSDTDYASIYTWIAEERATPCSIEP